MRKEASPRRSGVCGASCARPAAGCLCSPVKLTTCHLVGEGDQRQWKRPASPREGAPLARRCSARLTDSCAQQLLGYPDLRGASGAELHLPDGGLQVKGGLLGEHSLEIPRESIGSWLAPHPMSSTCRRDGDERLLAWLRGLELPKYGGQPPSPACPKECQRGPLLNGGGCSVGAPRPRCPNW